MPRILLVDDDASLLEVLARLGCPTEAPVLTLRSAVTPPRWRSGQGA